jgi:hypothetical protein
MLPDQAQFVNVAGGERIGLDVELAGVGEQGGLHRADLGGGAGDGGGGQAESGQPLFGR